MITVEGVRKDPTLYIYSSIDVQMDITKEHASRWLPEEFDDGEYEEDIDYDCKERFNLYEWDDSPDINYYPYGVDKDNCPLREHGLRLNGIARLKTLPIFKSLDRLVKENLDQSIPVNYIQEQGFFNDITWDELSEIVYEYFQTLSEHELDSCSVDRRKLGESIKLFDDSLKQLNVGFDEMKALKYAIIRQTERVHKGIIWEQGVDNKDGPNAVTTADIKILGGLTEKYRRLKNVVNGSIENTSGRYNDELGKLRIRKEQMKIESMQKNLEDKGVESKTKEIEARKIRIEEFKNTNKKMTLPMVGAIENQDSRRKILHVLNRMANIQKIPVVDPQEYEKLSKKHREDDEIVFD